VTLLKSIPDVPPGLPGQGTRFFDRLKEAVQSFLSGQGQIFPIWAQEGGGLANSTYEWAFGDGTAADQDAGLVLAVDCELFAMSLNIDAGMATVEVVKNGQVMNSYSVTVPHSNNAYRAFTTALKFSAGDRINFRTQITSGTSGPCVVAAWMKTR
jgi:hypothetical protein